MGFGGAIATCFRKYVDFTGRARRKEYWFWHLFYLLALCSCLWRSMAPSWPLMAARSCSRRWESWPLRCPHLRSSCDGCTTPTIRDGCISSCSSRSSGSSSSSSSCANAEPRGRTGLGPTRWAWTWRGPSNSGASLPAAREPHHLAPGRADACSPACQNGSCNRKITLVRGVAGNRRIVTTTRDAEGATVAEEAYYLDGSRNQQGPVPIAEIGRLIRGGTIRRDTLVWYPGMPDWRPASQVTELASFFSGAVPPPRPPAGPPPGQAMPPARRLPCSAGHPWRARIRAWDRKPSARPIGCRQGHGFRRRHRDLLPQIRGFHRKSPPGGILVVDVVQRAGLLGLGRRRCDDRQRSAARARCRIWWVWRCSCRRSPRECGVCMTPTAVGGGCSSGSFRWSDGSSSSSSCASAEPRGRTGSGRTRWGRTWRRHSNRRPSDLFALATRTSLPCWSSGPLFARLPKRIVQPQDRARSRRGRQRGATATRDAEGPTVAEEAYYLDGSRNQQGPVPIAEIGRLIRGGAIRRDTLVWYAGMTDWRPAGDVSELASLFVPAAPPRPPAGPLPPQAPRPSAQAPRFPAAAPRAHSPAAHGSGGAARSTRRPMAWLPSGRCGACSGACSWSSSAISS